LLEVTLLFVAIPRREKHGLKAGDVQFGVETRTEEKVPPAICAVLIIAGAGMAIAGRTKS